MWAIGQCSTLNIDDLIMLKKKRDNLNLMLWGDTLNAARSIQRYSRHNCKRITHRVACGIAF